MQYKKTLITILILLLSALLLASCQSDSSKEPTKIDLTYEEQVILDYQDLLKNRKTPDEIEAFFNIHFDQLDQQYCDSMIRAYETYLSLDLEEPTEKLYLNLVDYSRLIQYQPYLSDEYANYLTLYYNEYQSPDLNSSPPIENVSALLKKASLVENHLLNYKEGKTEQPMYELYVRYLYAALMNNGNPLSLEFNTEILDNYTMFVEEYSDSHTAEFVKSYLELIVSNKNDLESEELQDFYFNFYSLLRSYLWGIEKQ